MACTPTMYKGSNQSTGIDVRLRLATVALMGGNDPCWSFFLATGTAYGHLSKNFEYRMS